MIGTKSSLSIFFFLLCLIVAFGNQEVQGQSLNVRGNPEQRVVLGESATWIIELAACSEKPIPGMPISSVDWQIRQRQETLGRDSATGFWSAVWVIDVVPNTAGELEISPLTFFVGTETIKTPPFVLHVGHDKKSEGYAACSWESPKPVLWQGERIRLRSVFAYDEEFFNDHVLQPFKRPLDVPVGLRIEQPRNLANVGPPTWVVVNADSDLPSSSLVVNGSLARWRLGSERLHQGRPFATIFQEYDLVAGSLGEFRISGIRAKFDYANDFEDDFFQGRIPKDSQVGFVYGEPLSFSVRSLPDSGRPENFSGAVGQFEMRVRAAKNSLSSGEHFSISVIISGEGISGDVPAPSWPSNPGFRLLGVTRAEKRNEVTFIYDLEALSGGTFQLQSCSFAFFDPSDQGKYRVIKGQRFRIEVKGPSRESATVLPTILGFQDFLTEWDRENPAETTSMKLPAFALLSAIPWVICFVFWWWRRQRLKAWRNPKEARFRVALKNFHSKKSKRDKEPWERFACYLAAKMKVAEPRVHGRDLETLLLDSGVPSELAGRAAGINFVMTNARYGGVGTEFSALDLDELVADLEDAFGVER